MEIKLYHGSSSLFKIPYTYMSVFGSPSDGVGFHCCNYEEDVREYWLNGDVMYIYEYILSPRSILPKKVDKDLAMELTASVKTVGSETRPSEFAQSYWSNTAMKTFIENTLSPGMITSSFLFYLAKRCEDISLVCRTLSRMGYSHYIDEIADERGGHYHFIIFDANDLRVNKITQVMNSKGGLELDITDAVMKQLIV